VCDYIAAAPYSAKRRLQINAYEGADLFGFVILAQAGILLNQGPGSPLCEQPFRGLPA
jgi:hypothetical protein